MKDFQKKLKEQADEVQKTLEERNNMYEDVTDNGRKQSRIDGKDALLRCPQASGTP